MAGNIVTTGFVNGNMSGALGGGMDLNVAGFLDKRHALGKQMMLKPEELCDEDDEDLDDLDDLDGNESKGAVRRLEHTNDSCAVGSAIGGGGSNGDEAGATTGGSMGEAGGSSAAGDSAYGGNGKAAAPKRKAGRPILCDKDPNSADLTDAQRRILKRRMSNREYARRARQRRQELIRELQGQICGIQQENEVLVDEIKKEERHRGTLRRQIQLITTNMTFFVKENARLKAQYEAIAQYIQTSGFWEMQQGGGGSMMAGGGMAADSLLIADGGDVMMGGSVVGMPEPATSASLPGGGGGGRAGCSGSRGGMHFLQQQQAGEHLEQQHHHAADGMHSGSGLTEMDMHLAMNMADLCGQPHPMVKQEAAGGCEDLGWSSFQMFKLEEGGGQVGLQGGGDGANGKCQMPNDPSSATAAHHHNRYHDPLSTDGIQSAIAQQQQQGAGVNVGDTGGMAGSSDLDSTHMGMAQGHHQEQDLGLHMQMAVAQQ